MVSLLDENGTDFRCLLRDNDGKYTPLFDSVFASEGMKVIPLPYQAPYANAHAERWVRTIREECLDHILIWNDAHLQRVLCQFVDYYNNRRPQQSLDQQSPVARTPPVTDGPLACRQVLEGIINGYYRTPPRAALQSV
ncbi:MAG: transposase [Chloroflexi bacterium]|nr:transposase [Chloroflexota bacterium]